MTTTLVSLQLITRDMDASIGRLSERGDVAREVAYYRETIETIKTPEEFVADTRLFNFAMRAHGLEDMAYAKAFMLKVLKEGREDPEAFANQLSDPRYRDFAATYDFAAFGEAATVFTKARQGVIDRYLVQTLESEAGASDPGVRLALYFQRKAPEVTSHLEILADRALSEVVRTALGMPAEMATVDIDRQVEILAGRIDIEDFKDPAKLSDFIARFANMWQLNNGVSAAQSPVLALIAPSTSASLSTDLLLQLQQLGR